MLMTKCDYRDVATLRVTESFGLVPMQQEAFSKGVICMSDLESLHTLRVERTEGDVVVEQKWPAA